MDLRQLIEEEIEVEKDFLKQYREGLKATEKYRHLRLLTRRGSERYVLNKQSGEEYYIKRGKSEAISHIKTRRLCEVGVRNIEKNMKALEHLKKVYNSYDAASIEENLPLSYRTSKEELERMLADSSERTAKSNHGRNRRFTQSENPYHTENLKYFTSFGLVVRSRIEASIAEMAYSKGYYIMYEKKIILSDNVGEMHIVYPDFILCENEFTPDSCWIYWEHLGMLDFEEYRQQTLNKLKLYPMNGILFGRNLVLTCDDMNQGVDLRAVRNVLDSIEGLEARK